MKVKIIFNYYVIIPKLDNSFQNCLKSPHKNDWEKNGCFWTAVLEKTLESPLDCKEIQPVNPKGNQSWIFTEGTDAKALILSPPEVEITHWKRPWCWERLKAGGEGDDRGWDACMASPGQWTWAWASSGLWWRTRKPGMLQSMGHKELDMTEPMNNILLCNLHKVILSLMKVLWSRYNT